MLLKKDRKYSKIGVGGMGGAGQAGGYNGGGNATSSELVYNWMKQWYCVMCYIVSIEGY